MKTKRAALLRDAMSPRDAVMENALYKLSSGKETSLSSRELADICLSRARKGRCLSRTSAKIMGERMIDTVWNEIVQGMNTESPRHVLARHHLNDASVRDAWLACVGKHLDGHYCVAVVVVIVLFAKILHTKETKDLPTTDFDQLAHAFKLLFSCKEWRLQACLALDKVIGALVHVDAVTTAEAFNTQITLLTCGIVLDAESVITAEFAASRLEDASIADDVDGPAELACLCVVRCAFLDATFKADIAIGKGVKLWLSGKYDVWDEYREGLRMLENIRDAYRVSQLLEADVVDRTFLTALTDVVLMRHADFPASDEPEPESESANPSTRDSASGSTHDPARDSASDSSNDSASDPVLVKLFSFIDTMYDPVVRTEYSCGGMLSPTADARRSLEFAATIMTADPRCLEAAAEYHLRRLATGPDTPTLVHKVYDYLHRYYRDVTDVRKRLLWQRIIGRCVTCGITQNELVASRGTIDAQGRRNKIRTCNRCMLLRYCGVECQRKDWRSVHKHCCAKMAEIMAGPPQ